MSRKNKSPKAPLIEPTDTRPAVIREAYTMNEFCRAFRVSRSGLYDLWKAGKGPRRMQVASKTLISVEAARDWRMECEQEALHSHGT
jgi:hypothetical protein